MQKGRFDHAKGQLRAAERATTTNTALYDFLQTPYYQAQMGHRTIVMVHCIDNRHGSCMLTVHHDHIQRNRLGIKICMLNPYGRLGLKANDELNGT